MRTLLVMALLMGCGQDAARAPEVCPPVEAPAIPADPPPQLPAIDPFTLMFITNTLVDDVVTTMYRASRRWTRPLYRIVFPIGPKLGPWPRLGDRGLEGLSAKQMASLPRLQRAFSGLQVVEAAGDLHILDREDVELATVVVTDGASHKVRVTGPGIETAHGLQIGSPLADVLTLPVHHRCETLWNTINSGLTSLGAIRCWVGRGEHFRYVVPLDPRPGPVGAPLGPPADAPDDEPFESAADVPADGPALERWIAASGRKIDLILWERE
jgi:hypothetical protein